MLFHIKNKVLQWLKTWPFKVEVEGSSLQSCNLVGETILG
jgi:hypothetical protein